MYRFIVNLLCYFCLKNLIGYVWGIRVFRGYTFFGVRRIDFGGKRDWYLILKEEEEEFCKIDKVYKLNFILEKIDI